MSSWEEVRHRGAGGKDELSIEVLILEGFHISK